MQTLFSIDELGRQVLCGLMAPYHHCSLSIEEFNFLTALISTEPSKFFYFVFKMEKILIFNYFIGTPGLSETAKLLLEIEWRKFSTALRNHLQLMLGSKDAMEKRFAELISLARAIFHAGNVFMKTGQVPYYFKNALIFAINF